MPQKPTILYTLTKVCTTHIPYSGKVWRIDSSRAFGKRKFGELIDQPIAY